DFLTKAREPQNLAQHDAGVVESQRLIEVTRQQVMPLHPRLPWLHCSHEKGPLHRGAGRSVCVATSRASRQVAPASPVGFPVWRSIFELQAQNVMGTRYKRRATAVNSEA